MGVKALSKNGPFLIASQQYAELAEVPAVTMTDRDRNWYALNSAKLWLRSITYQGQRLLENARITGELFDLQVDQKQWEIHQDLRIAEEHFFITSVGKAEQWLREVQTLFPGLAQDIELFTSKLPEARDMRNMREHDTDYLGYSGKKGNAQARFLSIKPDVISDATSSIVQKDNYLLGGRLSVQQAMEAAEQLRPKIEESLSSKIWNTETQNVGDLY